MSLRPSDGADVGLGSSVTVMALAPDTRSRQSPRGLALKVGALVACVMTGAVVEAEPRASAIAAPPATSGAVSLRASARNHGAAPYDATLQSARWER